MNDAANLESIREHGLLSASCLNQQSIEAVMNLDVSSRAVDAQMGHQNFVRAALFQQGEPYETHRQE